MIGWLAEPFGEPIVLRALAELALLAVLSGALGSWIVVTGTSYGAESLAHGMLPGLVLAALLGIPLELGGAAGLLVAAVSIALVGRVPRLDRDVAVSVVITALFGLGVLLGLAPDTPAGLDAMLFGDVLAVGASDLALAAGAAVIVTAGLALLHHGLMLTGFDRLNARALGRSPAALDVALAVLLALATLIAVQALGTLLAVAMLVGPAATARLVSRRMVPAMLAATAIALAAAATGLAVSYHADLAAGASVALVLSGAFVLTLAGRAGADRLARRRAAA